MLPRWLRAASTLSPVLRWKLDDGADFAVEAVSGIRDEITSRTGHAIWVGEGRQRALRLDGYSVWLRHGPKAAICLADAVTVMAWIALEAYPVSEAALVEMSTKSGTLFRCSIDRFGHLQCGGQPFDAKSLCRSSEPIAKAKWIHLAASWDRGVLTLYRDGVPFGHQPNATVSVKDLEGINFVIGKSSDCAVIADVFPTGVLNGLLRDLQLFDRALSPDALKEILEVSRPEGPPDLQINGPWCIDDPQRPICHAQPPRAWTNEPYGFIHWRGQYHLFYQKNPDGPYWSRLNWGHMASPDLLNWTELPVAISPELPYESKGCWSGSVIEHAGKLTLIYTGVDEVKAGISLAFSEDGLNFIKYPGNPVIPSPPECGDYLDFRDPFVWREGEVYYLVVGSGIPGVGGTALLYRSKDLIGWDFIRQLYSGDKKTSGPFWEMPIFVRDGDRHALVVSELPGRASYWVGSWHDEKFAPISSMPRHLELFNHLLSPTPVIEKDGQIVVIGIIPDERSPQRMWRAGWAHLYSFPRVLSIDEGGVVIQPHPSLEALCRPLHSIPAVELRAGSVHDLTGLRETSLRIRATIRRGQSSSVSLLLRRSLKGEEQTEILYEWDQERLTLDRTKSSLDPMVRRDLQLTSYSTAEKNSLHLDVFVDRSVLEVFVDGRAAFAARIYPTLPESSGVAFLAVNTGARVERLTIARLEPSVK